MRRFGWESIIGGIMRTGGGVACGERGVCDDADGEFGGGSESGSAP